MANAAKIVLTEGDAPASPSAGTTSIYFKTDHVLYKKDHDGTETAFASFDPAAPGAIGETTPSTIRGLNKEIYKTQSADSPLTAAECSGTIVSNYGMADADCTIDLPTAAEGLAFICILPTVQAHFFHLKCPSAQTDKINLLTSGAWVAGSDDGYVGVASGYSANASISMFCAKITDGTYEWFAMPVAGTWVAG
jgi:hypothetical protein